MIARAPWDAVGRRDATRNGGISPRDWKFCLAMTSKERVLTAMRRGQPDRVPINIRGVRVWDEQWAATCHVSYRRLIEVVQQHCDIIPHASVPGLDLPLFTEAMKEMTETRLIDAGDWEITHVIVHTPKGDLSQDYWESREARPPLTKRYFVKEPEDVEKVLSVPSVAPKLDLSGYFRLREEWPDNVVMCDCPQAASVVHELLGSEMFAYWWAEHRDLLFRLRDAFQERVLAAVDSMLEAGVGPVLATHGSEQIAPPLYSPETYREFVLPVFGELCRKVHEAGCLLHVHCHNKLNAVLEDIAEVGWDVVHPLEPPPMGDVDLADAKRRIGDRVCLEGNIQIGELYGSPTERVVELVTEAMEAGKPGGGFILCPSASPHTPRLSHVTGRNYLAMIKTGVRLRAY